VVRALEQQAEVALQLAMVRREDHVDVVFPAASRDAGEHPAERFVDELALDRVAGVHLAHLIGGERRGHPREGRS
jgi:hypothetical protein